MKHIASTLIGGFGALLFAIAMWLAFYAIKGIPVADPGDEFAPLFAYIASQAKLETLTLAACILISSAVFIVGALLLHHLEERRPDGGNG